MLLTLMDLLNDLLILQKVAKVKKTKDNPATVFF